MTDLQGPSRTLDVVTQIKPSWSSSDSQAFVSRFMTTCRMCDMSARIGGNLGQSQSQNLMLRETVTLISCITSSTTLERLIAVSGPAGAGLAYTVKLYTMSAALDRDRTDSLDIAVRRLNLVEVPTAPGPPRR